MKLRDITKAVTEKLWVPHTVVAPVAQEIFDQIILALSKEKEISIHWFWKFSITNRKSKNWVNPRTLEKMIVPARNTIKLTVSTVIKKLINL
jgi:nucleoid DNA-binding protein